MPQAGTYVVQYPKKQKNFRAGKALKFFRPIQVTYIARRGETAPWHGLLSINGNAVPSKAQESSWLEFIYFLASVLRQFCMGRVLHRAGL